MATGNGNYNSRWHGAMGSKRSGSSEARSKWHRFLDKALDPMQWWTVFLFIVMVTLVMAYLTATTGCSREGENITTPTPVVDPAVPTASSATGAAPIGTPMGTLGIMIDDRGNVTGSFDSPHAIKVCTYWLLEEHPGAQELARESWPLTSPVEWKHGYHDGCRMQIDVIDQRPCPRYGNPPTFGGGLIAARVVGYGVCKRS